MGFGIATRIAPVCKWVFPYNVCLAWKRNIWWLLYNPSILKFFLKRYYFNKHKLPNDWKNGRQTIVYMADGAIHSGGLADRLKGIVSCYKMSLHFGVDFKICFTSPTPLTDYLLPNKHNWLIEQKDVIFNSKFSVPLSLWYNYGEPWSIKRVGEALKTYKQIHIYSNLDIAEKDFGVLYKELFKPVPALQSKIEKHLQKLGGGGYTSATFRFQQRLGDFMEGHSQSESDKNILPKDEQEKLISLCLDRLKEIHLENPNKTILVTSDSIRFLERAKETFDFIYVVPGEIAHIDFGEKRDSSVYEKSFIDFYTLAEAQKVYLIVEGEMYNSGFAWMASRLNAKYQIKSSKLQMYTRDVI